MSLGVLRDEVVKAGRPGLQGSRGTAERSDLAALVRVEQFDLSHATVRRLDHLPVRLGAVPGELPYHGQGETPGAVVTAEAGPAGIDGDGNGQGEDGHRGRVVLQRCLYPALVFTVIGGEQERDRGPGQSRRGRWPGWPSGRPQLTPDVVSQIAERGVAVRPREHQHRRLSQDRRPN